jgi:hypothetical protein
MRSYRFTVRYAGQRITHDFKATNDDEAQKNFINELKAKKGKWEKEVTYSPSKIFITYEELNVASQ